ncbi:MAG TPA: hypothetical protein VJ944_01880 [Thermoplasmataceae archaeon]|nr:hypothetical protein [Thermoplasmataceae archaeon]
MPAGKEVDKDDEFPVKHFIYLIIGTIAIAIVVVLAIPLLS